MKLKMNKASDLSSISVLPPHARRPSVVPSATESSVFGKSQPSQARSQQQSQQSFSQGFSSQQAVYSQLSQSSLDDFVPNEQRLGSQERENSAKRMSCLPHINYTREETQMQLSKPSTNYLRKWSVPESKYQIEELEHKIGMVETSLSRQGMILDSIQSDIMQVNRGTKEMLMEMESLRPKLFSHDELLQLMNKEREDLKASLEGTFKSMFEKFRENKYQESIRDLLSLLRAMPNKLEMCILQLQTDLSKTLAKEIQIIAPRPDCHGQKHETTPVDPPKGINDCIPPREVKLLKKDQKTTMPPKIEMGSWTTVKINQTCMKQKIPIRSYTQNEAFQQKIPIRSHTQNEAFQQKIPIRSHTQNEAFRQKIPIRSRTQNEAFQQKIPIRSHTQNGTFQQERGCRITIESDEDIDAGFSCLLEENGTGIYPLDDAKEESARILRKARRLKRKHFNTIIID